MLYKSENQPAIMYIKLLENFLKYTAWFNIILDLFLSISTAIASKLETLPIFVIWNQIFSSFYNH